MSIIYEALKKAGKSIHVDPQPQIIDKQKDSKPKIKLYILYALVACRGLLAGNVVFGFLANPKNPQVAKVKLPLEPVTRPREVLPLPPAATELGAIKDKPQEAFTPLERGFLTGFTLNGVFFSEGEGYALINNKIVKVQDVVGGATVKKIGLDEVELEISGTITKLYTRAQ
jgi:hypothetical protein